MNLSKMLRDRSWHALLFGALVCIVVVLSGTSSLPAKVASHFNADGTADGWMRPDELALSFIILGVVGAAFFCGICSIPRLIPAGFLDTENARYWRKRENHLRACDLLMKGSRWMGMLHFLWTGALFRVVAAANQSSPPVLSTAGVNSCSGLYLIAALILAAFTLWNMMKERPSQ